MGRPKVEPPDAAKRIDVRMTVDEYTRVRYAYVLTGITSVSEWLRPQVLAIADRVIAESGRTIEFGHTAAGKPAAGKRASPRKAS
jgi:hypothetical protein